MDLETIRRKYAEEVCARANVHQEALVEAFARVPRERFLGPGPWLIAQLLNPEVPFRTTPDAQIEHLYQDVAMAIDPVRQVNNGQPSFHARWMDAVAPKPGQSILHVGCGVGYYTAILAELVGPSGRVVAYEIDPDLAARARANLTQWRQVRVEVGDSSEPHGPYDIIYVNAGTTHARQEWLSSLAQEGRLLLPLTVHRPKFPVGIGFVVCVERHGRYWPVRVVSPVGMYDCAGARDESAESQLHRLLGPAARIRTMSIERHPQSYPCLVHIDGFCLRA
jgi:protein-L-isoaspartate(D-aspartate) O-methyltransferase